MYIQSMMLSNHLIPCCPLLLPSVFPSIRVFSKESVLSITWPKYWIQGEAAAPLGGGGCGHGAQGGTGGTQELVQRSEAEESHAGGLWGRGGGQGYGAAASNVLG